MRIRLGWEEIAFPKEMPNTCHKWRNHRVIESEEGQTFGLHKTCSKTTRQNKIDKRYRYHKYHSPFLAALDHIPGHPLCFWITAARIKVYDQPSLDFFSQKHSLSDHRSLLSAIHRMLIASPVFLQLSQIVFTPPRYRKRHTDQLTASTREDTSRNSTYGWEKPSCWNSSVLLEAYLLLQHQKSAVNMIIQTWQEDHIHCLTQTVICINADDVSQSPIIKDKGWMTVKVSHWGSLSI